jgi:DNA-directed RNA polymerase subunit RPC12/RpoP
MNQPKKDQQVLNQNVTNDDLVECKCGHKLFYSANRIAVKANPLIGQPPAVFTFPTAVICVKCGEELNIKEKLKEKEKG